MNFLSKVQSKHEFNTRLVEVKQIQRQAALSDTALMGICRLDSEPRRGHPQFTVSTAESYLALRLGGATVNLLRPRLPGQIARHDVFHWQSLLWDE
jgi:hypothetical protein